MAKFTTDQNIKLDDNNKIEFGTGTGTTISHDGSDLRFDTEAGDLKLQSVYGGAEFHCVNNIEIHSSSYDTVIYSDQGHTIVSGALDVYVATTPGSNKHVCLRADGIVYTSKILSIGNEDLEDLRITIPDSGSHNMVHDGSYTKGLQIASVYKDLVLQGTDGVTIQADGTTDITLSATGGKTVAGTFEATSVSGTTIYGDGANITGIDKYTEAEVDALTWTESDITDLDKYTQAEVTTISGDIVGQISTDHGALTGLADDDHTQYLLADGTRTLTGTFTLAGRMSVTDTGNSVFIGEDAGAVDDLTDNRNVFIGYQAGKVNTTGNHNIALGLRPLYTNTTGYDNLAIGSESLYTNLNGASNTAIGPDTLHGNTSGQANIAIGSKALYTNTDGCGQTAIGSNALWQHNGYSNTGVGSSALSNLTTGNYNIALGGSAGRYYGTGTSSLTSASYSIYIGYKARGYSNSDDNSIVIGKDAVGLGANTTVIGGSATTKTSLAGTVAVTDIEATGDIEVASAKAYYIGNPTTSGSWRQRISGEDLVFEKYDGASWNVKSTITG